MASTSSPKSDWLDVTTAPDSGVCDRILDLLLSVTDDIRRDEVKKRTVVSLDSGKITLDSSDRFERVSASGSALAALRMHTLFDEYLSRLSETPHRLTRLDVAYDTDEDFPRVLHRLRTKYPDGKAPLSRKSLRMTEILSKRDSDGKPTGTVYFGYRSKARVSARIYDKQEEAFQNRGEILPPRTRYELTVRSEMGATLKDAHSPDSIFWHYMSPSHLKLPKGLVPDAWEPDRSFHWESLRSEVDHAKRLRSLVENSSLIDHLISEADLLSPSEGRVYLARLLSSRIGRSVKLGG